jgi:hypothetical protein
MRQNVLTARTLKPLFRQYVISAREEPGRINSFYGARPNLKEFAPEGIEGELRRLHYDTANATFAPSMAALMKLVPVSQITYGTTTRISVWARWPTCRNSDCRSANLMPLATRMRRA